MAASEHFAILVNPLSGKGKGERIIPELTRFLDSNNLTYSIFRSDYPKSLQGFTSLIIIGGDGTLNYILNFYREIPIPIGLIPGGTGNDYATLHQGTSTLMNQFNVATFGSIRKADAGLCNGKIFINGIGIGFDGWVVRKNLGKRFFTGKAAYYSTIVSLLLFYKESQVFFKTENTEWTQTLFMASIAKGKSYGGGFCVAPNASPFNGTFDINTVSSINLFNRIRYLPAIEKGKHLHLPFIRQEHDSNLQIRCSHPLQAHLDGEWMESNEFEISLLKEKYFIRTSLIT